MSTASRQRFVHRDPTAMTKTRQEEMHEECKAFHAEHPEVWRLFVRFAFELIQRGFKNGGAGAIFERIRWEIAQAGDDGKSSFKLNNNHRAFYARWFAATYPDHAEFFRTRTQISEDAPPTNLPPLGPEDFPYTNQGAQ